MNLRGKTLTHWHCLSISIRTQCMQMQWTTPTGRWLPAGADLLPKATFSNLFLYTRPLSVIGHLCVNEGGGGGRGGPNPQSTDVTTLTATATLFSQARGLAGDWSGVNYQYFLCGESRLMIIVRRVCQVCCCCCCCCRNLLQNAITKRYQRSRSSCTSATYSSICSSSSCSCSLFKS